MSDRPRHPAITLSNADGRNATIIAHRDGERFDVLGVAGRSHLRDQPGPEASEAVADHMDWSYARARGYLTALSALVLLYEGVSGE